MRESLKSELFKLQTGQGSQMLIRRTAGVGGVRAPHPGLLDRVLLSWFVWER